VEVIVENIELFPFEPVEDAELPPPPTVTV
jgi:hypothetical protein